MQGVPKVRLQTTPISGALNQRPTRRLKLKVRGKSSMIAC